MVHAFKPSVPQVLRSLSLRPVLSTEQVQDRQVGFKQWILYNIFLKSLKRGSQHLQN